MNDAINGQSASFGRFVRPLIGVLLLVLCGTALAADPSADRKAAFKTILRTFEPMGVVVRGRDPYVAKQFLQ